MPARVTNCPRYSRLSGSSNTLHSLAHRPSYAAIDGGQAKRLRKIGERTPFLVPPSWDRQNLCKPSKESYHLPRTAMSGVYAYVTRSWSIMLTGYGLSLFLAAVANCYLRCGSGDFSRSYTSLQYIFFLQAFYWSSRNFALSCYRVGCFFLRPSPPNCA